MVKLIYLLYIIKEFILQHDVQPTRMNYYINDKWTTLPFQVWISIFLEYFYRGVPKVSIIDCLSHPVLTHMRLPDAS